MISPRTTRLLRVPDLRSLHIVIAECAAAPVEINTATAILVPTRAAAEEMRRTLEARLLGSERAAIVVPALLTRAEFYVRLHTAVPDAPPLLTEFEREVLFRRAALTAHASGAPAPFRLRPGLIAQLLGFYDQLRRRDRSVDDFARLMLGSLEGSAEIDRGAQRLLDQTRFLAAAFDEFERAIESTGRLDEHRLRKLLLEGTVSSPFRRVVVTVADQAADPHGLWNADYGLLTRMTGIDAIDVIATEAVLATGFHERIHDLLPGIEEEKGAFAASGPVLAVPQPDGDQVPLRWFVARDREEELVDVARIAAAHPAAHRVAAVFQRPLPYLYLARDVFANAALPYQASDALPLAAEPFAAAIDLIFAFIGGEGTRAATIELLRSPHWRFTNAALTGGATEVADEAALTGGATEVADEAALKGCATEVADEAALKGCATDPEHVSAGVVCAVPVHASAVADDVNESVAQGFSPATTLPVADSAAAPVAQGFSPVNADREIAQDEVAALDALFRELKYVGGWEQLATIAARAPEPRQTGKRALAGRAFAALQAAVAAAAELRPVADASSASAQIAALRSFIRAHERLPSPTDAWYARHLRARGAVLAALDSLAEAHLRYDDERVPASELFGTIRRWMEGQTFSPRTGTDGVSLLDATTAAFADVDEIRVLGLVDTDWPDRPERSIFYPSSLLSQLGWPADAVRLSAARARFHDLLRLAKQRVSLSTFTLEDDAIVAPSVFLDELDVAGLAVEQAAPVSESALFTHELLMDGVLEPHGVSAHAWEWLALRRSRTDAGAAMFQGTTGLREPEVYAVSHLERYLDCPFKYFASYVLRLDEERDEEAGLTPQERGQFVHAVFERFFAQWQGSGGGSITTQNLPDALAMFADVAEAQLASLPEADRAMERTHLLGSAAAPGLAERAFTFEIDHGLDVRERLLEHALEGEFRFQGTAGSQTVRLRAKADRIDLLTDGTIRLIDYKLGKAPKPKRSLQLAVYGICAEQHLEGRHGRAWTLGRAGYVAFREKNAFVELGGSAAQLAKALADGQTRLLDAVEAIQAGSFPVRPDEPWLCTRCGFSLVCRKDYVGDE